MIESSLDDQHCPNCPNIVEISGMKILTRDCACQDVMTLLSLKSHEELKLLLQEMFPYLTDEIEVVVSEYQRSSSAIVKIRGAHMCASSYLYQHVRRSGILLSLQELSQ